MRNERLLSEYHWTREELLGKTTLEAGLWTSKDRDRMLETFKRDGCIVDFDSVGIGRDGVHRKISLSAAQVEVARGTVIRAAMERAVRTNVMVNSW